MGKTFGSGDSTTQKKASSSTDSTKLPLAGGTLTGDVTMDTATPTITLGNGTDHNTDKQIQFLSVTRDYHITHDDSERTLLIGEWNGSDPNVDVGIKVSEDGALQLNQNITVGTGAAADTKIVFDGNAQDYHIGVDDTDDILKIGHGNSVGTTPAIQINSSAETSIGGDLTVQDAITIIGTTPTLTIGDAGTEDTKIVFDGNALDFYVGLDDGTDSLMIGTGATVGSAGIMSMNTTGLAAGRGLYYLPATKVDTGDSGTTITSQQPAITVVLTNGAGFVTLPDSPDIGFQVVVCNAHTGTNSGAIRRGGSSNQFYDSDTTGGEAGNQGIAAMKAKTCIYYATNKWLVIG